MSPLATNVKRDYYEVLDVSRTANDQEIKSSYRKLALQFHPDRNPDNPEAEEKFKECSEAYAVLADTEKRARYDRFGHAGVGGNGARRRRIRCHRFVDFQEIFGDLFGFGDMFGGGGRRPFARATRRRPARGHDPGIRRSSLRRDQASRGAPSRRVRPVQRLGRRTRQIAHQLHHLRRTRPDALSAGLLLASRAPAAPAVDRAS